MKRVIALIAALSLVAGCGKVSKLANTESVPAPVVDDRLMVPASALVYTVIGSVVCIAGMFVYFKRTYCDGYKNGYDAGASEQYTDDLKKTEDLYRNTFNMGRDAQFYHDTMWFITVRNESYTLGYNEGYKHDQIRPGIYKGENNGKYLEPNTITKTNMADNDKGKAMGLLTKLTHKERKV